MVRVSLPTCFTTSVGEKIECKSADSSALYTHFLNAAPDSFKVGRHFTLAFQDQGICFRIGPYWCRVRSQVAELLDPLLNLYQDYDLRLGLPKQIVSDFDIQISEIKKYPWSDSEVEFRWRGYPPLPPLPRSQVHPLFEWGLNWSLATLLGTEIVIHSAILERNGMAIALPGEPGAGKSTLCAALALSGWRLLSDELTVIHIDTGLAIPLPRPISLKDKAIEVVSERYPEAEITDPVEETRKGRISYVRPPSGAVKDALNKVPIRFVLCPRYKEGADLLVASMTGSESLTKLMAQTFNLGLLGHEGFSRLASIAASAHGFSLEYGNLDTALKWIDSNCQ